MVKAKFSLSMALLCFVFTMATSNTVKSADSKTLESGDFDWNGGKFITRDTETWNRGEIVYYSKNLEICNSPLLIPGAALYPNGVLGVFYAITLIYLFLGIGIVSDVFMSGIERITSTTQIV